MQGTDESSQEPRPAAGGGARDGVSGGPMERRPPSWKVLLAMVSLAISLLLWLNGLAESLHRPSVGQDLNRRQLELAVLAKPALPQPLATWLGGENPIKELDTLLAKDQQHRAEAGQPAAAAVLLERALLRHAQGDGPGAAPLLQELLNQPQTPIGGSSRQVAETLLNGDIPPATEALDLSRRLQAGSLVEQLSCTALGADPLACGQPAAARKASLQLLTVTVLPGLALLLGLGLLVRELWQRWRGHGLPLAPLAGPELTAVDGVLLVAGGFVVVGELLTPLLLSPLLEGLLKRLQLQGPLGDGLTVLLLYTGLMAGPLLILGLMLRGLGTAPQEGWLRFRWRPLASSLRSALRTVLQVLPAVSLVGWLQASIWGDPGGSNPLLELVLKSHNLPALACFAVTAVVLAPLFEETIFRGVLLPLAARSWGGLGGVVVSAAVFALAHLSLGELPPLFMLGLGLGWLRLQGGRLGACVLMHGLWNAMTFSNLLLLGG